jgi:L-alanine-DL-glutamate epimerase-like enolase superfamily enzyme
MRITEFVIYHVRIPLRKPVRHASHSRSDTESLVVRCRLDNGALGWGEGLPREYVTGESIDDAWTLLQATDFSKQLAAPFNDLPEAISLLDRFQLTAIALATLFAAHWS